MNIKRKLFNFSSHSIRKIEMNPYNTKKRAKIKQLYLISSISILFYLYFPVFIFPKLIYQMYETSQFYINNKNK